MARGRVLVVDDDPAIRRVVSEILALEGYAVQAAANGAEALALLTPELPTLVLLDMRMPVLDGWGFIAALRAQALDVPVCVMTAAQDAEAWAKEVAIPTYLAKPFELSHLLAVVERACA